MKLIIGKADGINFSIDAQELVTGRTCVIAQSGAGKSWSIAVLCEKLCRARIGFCLIDTEGEYFSLRDKFDVIWIGSDEESDEDIETVNLRDVMADAVQENLAVIYDVSETNMQERTSKLVNVLYEVATEQRRPYLLIIEEADKFIPQSGESIKKIEEVSRRGRKRGLGMLIATQRPALVTKNVLSQCNNQIIGKLSIDHDLKAVDIFFNSRKEADELSTLNPGEFFVMGKLVKERTRIRFAKRETQHRGLTPQLEIQPSPEPVPAQAVEKTEPPKKKVRDRTISAPLKEVAKKAPLQGIRPVITRDKALEIAEARRRKKILRIGVEERIAGCELLFWPLAAVELKYIGGIVKKTGKKANFVLDCRYGHCTDLSGGLRFRPGFAELVGLPEGAVTILSRMKTSGSTETEIEGATKLSPNTVRKDLGTLEERRLVTTTGVVGDVPVYVPLLIHEIPKFWLLRGTAELERSAVDGSVINAVLERDDLQTIVKGIEKTSEITQFEHFAYPVYEVTLASERMKRTLYIDALTGNEITTEL